ncbi:MAG: hypothetical protein ACT6RN_21980 [Agrobacterium sp.]|uniref:hypothetical protein n=1 Tax=Agrobacterium sp. TaxID=361 RepID=UPI004033A517
MPNVSTTADDKQAVENQPLPKRKEWKGLYPKVTVRLNGPLGDVVDELQEATHAASPSDVVKRALVIYHTLVKQKLAGNEPYIEQKEGDTTKRIPIFL